MKNYWLLLGIVLTLMSCKQQVAEVEVVVEDVITDNLLKDYVNKADDSFSYEILDTKKGDGYTEYIIKMISGHWLSPDEVNETEWWHHINMIKPDQLTQSEAMVIVGGGSSKDKIQSSNAMLQQAAVMTSSIIAEVSNIPFQPLDYVNDTQGPVYEDAIIAYGWKRFLEGGAKDEDVEWLARLPMTRAVSRAMDVVQELSLEIANTKVDSFVIAGASKRGWTTWTTAVVDDRVMAIAPIVIDMLNILPSFQHHWRVYGDWSPAINDYIEAGIMEWQGSAEYDRLMELVEPYSFIEELDMPKFMINATGDEFFVTDSWQFYWDDLVGEKYVQYVPNANHSLNGSYNLGSLVGFYNTIINDEPLPTFDWSVEGNKITLKLDPSQKFRITKWEAFNDKGRDFRLARIGDSWQPIDLGVSENGLYEVEIDTPKSGHKAGMIEVVFNPGTTRMMTFTTGTVVTDDTYPFEPFVPEQPKGSRE